MKDWKLVAQAYDLGIPNEELERITPPLDTLEAAFRPLVRTIPLDIEPVVKYDCPREEAK